MHEMPKCHSISPLKNYRVDIVQFEYSLINLSIRVFIDDFYRFGRFGFVIGKLLQHGVGFKPYEVEDDDFSGLNFVACSQDGSDLLAAIGCEPLSLGTSATRRKSPVRISSR